MQFAVCGAGTMGQGIAQVCAQAGYEVWLYDPIAEARERAQQALQDILEHLQQRGRLRESAAAILQRIHKVDTLTALPQVTVVFEAAPERLELKQRLLAELAAHLPDAILASNTSTLSITSIASAVPEPSRVIGMHFFNPAPLMALVEVIPGLRSSETVCAQAMDIAHALGKMPVQASDSPGFIVNRVARPFYLEALALHAEGLSCQTIDTVMRSLGFRMGPFELMDVIGLDVNLASSQHVYEAFFYHPRYRPQPLQQRLVEAGQLGRKSGQGFYQHPYQRPDLPQRNKQARLPQAYLSGANASNRSLADALRSSLSFSDSVEEASVVLQLSAEPLPPELLQLPVLHFAAYGSASAIAARYRQRGHRNLVATFSLLPPLHDSSMVELFAPLGNNDMATLEAAERYFAAHGLPSMRLPDMAAGVGLRVLARLINEAVSALHEQLSSAEGIDHAMRLGVNYPLGPLAWSERLGLATVYSALQQLYQEGADPAYAPQPLLSRMVAAGLERWQER